MMIADKILLDDDVVQPFMIDASGINGRLVKLGSAVDTILSRHDYPDAVNFILGKFLALGGALAMALKYEGIFTLQLKGDGPVPLMVVDVTSEGDIRGYAQVKGEMPPEIDLEIAPAAALFGKGYLAFTVDQGTDMDRYQGIVELKGKTLEECVAHYFEQSDQFSSAVKLAADKTLDGTWRAAAIVIQRVPEEGGVKAVKETEDDWRRAKILMETAKESELLSPELAPNDLLFRLFHEDGVRVFDAKPVDIGCRCSRDKISGVIVQLSDDDIEHAKVDGVIEVTCEFCNQAFAFNDDDIASLREQA